MRLTLKAYCYRGEITHTAFGPNARYQQIAVHAALQDYNFHTRYLLTMRGKEHTKGPSELTTGPAGRAQGDCGQLRRAGRQFDVLQFGASIQCCSALLSC